MGEYGELIHGLLKNSEESGVSSPEPVMKRPAKAKRFESESDDEASDADDHLMLLDASAWLLATPTDPPTPCACSKP